MMHLFSVNYLSPTSIIISFNFTFLLDPFQRGTEWPWLKLISHECTEIVAITHHQTLLHSLSFARHLMTCCEKISKFLFLSWLILETDFTLKIRKETSKWPLSPRLSLLSLAQWQGSSGEANRDFCLLFSVVHIHKFVACYASVTV